MPLELYRKKRNFGTTPEPRGRVGARKARGLSFVIQKHRASHLHYDFRLELDGVLLSWAVPKGPSLDPGVKRLAMHVEDHPLDYGEFEGIIPPKQYGAGTVMLWDRGVWIPEGDDVRADYKRGRLKFRLEGEKLHGSWALVRTWGKDGDARRWLLIKHDDEYAAPESERNITEEEDRSVATGRDLDEIAAQADATWQSNRAEPRAVKKPTTTQKKSTTTQKKPTTTQKKPTTTQKNPTTTQKKPATTQKKPTTTHRAATAKQPSKRAASRAAEAMKGRHPGASRDPVPRAPTKAARTTLALDGATKAAMPETQGAMLCTLVKHIPRTPGWLHEIKFDGYRMLARVDRGRVAIISRNGRDWTEQLRPVADALATLPLKQAWLDGEVVVSLPDGRTSFQALQLALGADPSKLQYYAFDLLYLDGYDLRELPLVERKQHLKRLMPTRSKLLRYSDHYEGDGADFLAEACRTKLEGVVSKKRDSTYHATRGGAWVKTKCSLRQELVIGGWTEPSGSRAAFGALLLGAYEGKALRYAGKVGTGFDTKTLLDVHRRLQPLAAKEPAFANPPRGADARGAHWVKPQLVAEIEFTEWTNEGTARHPSFKGLRLDKKASEVVIEEPVDLPATKSKNAAKPDGVPVGGAEAPTARRSARSEKHRGFRPSHSDSGGRRENRVVISSPDKILYPEAKITKLDIANYYRAIGDWMLPYLEGRPLTLVRCPNGYNAPCFYQKHVKPGTSELLTRVKVPEGDGNAIYMSADNTEAIVALLQMGVLEIHPWGSRVPHLDKPDVVIFDFDPDEGLGYAQVVEAAQLMREALAQIDLRCFVKTTGGKGLHVVVPFEPRVAWDEVKAFTKAIADSFASGFPAKFTSKLSKASRGQKIFIDYLRNAEGATAIAPYSVRAKKNAPVATPVHWEELAQDVRFDHFNVRNVPQRLAKLKKDPWADFFEVKQRLTKKMLKSVGLG